MLTTVAVLIILLGLMVSLAWDVRRQSSDRLTKDLLVKLDALTVQYADHHRRLPAVTPFLAAASPGSTSAAPLPAVRYDADLPDEPVLLAAAGVNNRDFVLALRTEAGLAPGVFGPLDGTMYDEISLRDAWGTPIVFMPSMHPAIGMALQNKAFFFSAGPDRKFRTLEDNLYSYEVGTAGPKLATR